MGGNSCKRILSINKLHEASVKKKKGFGEDIEGGSLRFPPTSSAFSSQEQRRGARKYILQVVKRCFSGAFW